MCGPSVIHVGATVPPTYFWTALVAAVMLCVVSAWLDAGFVAAWKIAWRAAQMYNTTITGPVVVGCQLAILIAVA